MIHTSHLKGLSNAWFFTTIALIVPCSHAQISGNLYNLQANKIQPEQTPFTGPVSAEVSAKGDLIFSIPLLELEARKVRYPVQLSYQAGIKPEQFATWVGLGWNFDPGSIVREVRAAHRIGVELGGTNSSHGTDLYDSGSIKRVPDQFQLQVPGYGGFSFMQSNLSAFNPTTVPTYGASSFVPNPQRAVKIEAFSSGPVCVDGICTGLNTGYTAQSFVQRPDISAFLVTTEDGTRYYFGSPTLSFIDNMTHVNGQPQTYRELFVSTWRIKWILGSDYTGSATIAPIDGASGSWMRFDYHPVVTYAPSRLGGTNSFMYASESRFGQVQFLSHIDSPMGSPHQRTTFFTTNRVDPRDAFDCRPKNDPNECLTPFYGRKLDSIQSATGRVVLETQTGLNAFPPYVIPNGNTPAHGRLKLTGIRFYDYAGYNERPGYTFTYYDGPQLPAPSLLIGTSNWPATPEMLNRDYLDGFGYLRNLVAEGISYPIDARTWAWSLESIVHPTGSKTSLLYEQDAVFPGSYTIQTDVGPILVNNEIEYVSVVESPACASACLDMESYVVNESSPYSHRFQGGLRVRKITRMDGNGGQEEMEYTYGNGFLNGLPPREMFLGASSDMLVMSSANYAPGDIGVFYEWVESSRLDPIAEVGLERTRTWYSNRSNYESLYTNGQFSFMGGLRIIPTKSALYSKSHSCINPYAFPYDPTQISCVYRSAFHDQNHLAWGHPYRIQTYRYDSGVWVEAEKKVFLTDLGVLTILSTNWKNTGSNPNFNVVNQDESFLRSRTTSQDIHQYDQNGSYVSQVTTNRSYDNRTNFVNSTVTSVGSQMRREQKMFAFDLYPEMKSRNMLSQLARIDLSDGYDRFISSEAYTWRVPTGRSFFAQWGVHVWKSDAISTTPPVFNTWTSSSSPSGWFRSVEAATYDADANPTLVRGPNGQEVTYTYTRFGTRPAIIAFRKSPGSTIGQLTLEYSAYETFGNPTLIRDEAKTDTHLSYDSHGRLTSIKNHDFELMQQLEYLPFRSSLTGWTFTNNHISVTPNRILSTRFNQVPGQLQTSAIQANYFDGFANLIQTQQQAPGSWYVSHRVNNGFGLTVREWGIYADSTIGATPTYRSDAATRSRAWYAAYFGLDALILPVTDTQYEYLNNPFPATVKLPNNNGIPDIIIVKKEKLSTESLLCDKTTLADGTVSRICRDGFGNPMVEQQGVGTPEQATIRRTFDGLGRLLQVTDPRNLATTYLYNSRNQIRQKTTPESGTTRYAHDQTGRLRYWQDARQAAAGRVGFRTYDFVGRPLIDGEAVAVFNSLNPDASTPPSFETPAGSANWLQISHYDGVVSETSYPYVLFYDQILTFYDEDPERMNHLTGRQSAVATRSGGVWQLELYAYNHLGQRITTEVLTEGAPTRDTRFAYTYDRQGNLLARTDAVSGVGSFTHWYEYDQLDRLTSIHASTTSKPAIPDARYTYTPTNTPSSMRFSNQPAVPYGYDIRWRLTTIGNVADAGRPFSAAIKYTPASNIAQAEFNQPGSPHPDKRYQYTYDYDSRHQLLAAHYARYSGGVYVAAPAYGVDTVRYDLAGNILQLRRRDDGGGYLQDLSYSYPGTNNKLSGYTDAAAVPEPMDVLFSHDANGNVTLMEDAYPNIYAVMTYDPYNRMTTYSDLGVETRYRHNAAGARYWRRANSGAIEFTVRDGTAAVGVFGTQSLWYLRAPDGTAIGRHSSSVTTYFLKDYLGSIRTRVDAAGTVLETHDYYPFGLAMPGRSGSVGTATALRFTGYERDTESGLDYAQARMYNPMLGRFLGVDPLAEHSPSWSTYAYVMNNPVRLVDPTGMSPEGNCNGEENRESLCGFGPPIIARKSAPTKGLGTQEQQQVGTKEVNAWLTGLGLSSSAIEEFWKHFNSSYNAKRQASALGIYSPNPYDEIIRTHAKYAEIAHSAGQVLWAIEFYLLVDQYKNPTANDIRSSTTDFVVSTVGTFGGPKGFAASLIYLGGKYYITMIDNAVLQGDYVTNPNPTYRYIPGTVPIFHKPKW